MFKAKFLVLEVQSGTYQGNDWAKIKIRSNELLNNQIVSAKVDLKKVPLASLQKALDSEVNLSFEFSKGDKDALGVKVSDLS